MTTMRLIGMDGLSSDETVIRYYWDGKHLYSYLWGETRRENIDLAKKYISQNIELQKKYLLDPIDEQRLSACQQLLAELEKLPQ